MVLHTKLSTVESLYILFFNKADGYIEYTIALNTWRYFILMKNMG